MRNFSTLLIACLSFAAVPVSAADDPQLQMCKAVTTNLIEETVSNWGEVNQSDTSELRSIDIAFTQKNGDNSSVECLYPIDQSGYVDTAPSEVSLNGSKVGTKKLLSAGTKASKELLSEGAGKTVARSKEIASDVADKTKETAASAGQFAKDLAEKARLKTLEATKKLQEKLEK